jgi:xanthine dehydrogenase YagR molybdenum-binding subunit
MTTAAPEPKANMGQPAPRVDGRLKVTGEARYGADFAVSNPAYAFLVTSPIAKGRIIGFDLAEATAVPGVLDILTHENAHGLKPAKFFADGGTASTRIQPLESAKIWHDGQIIAVVVADTFEASREAAHKVRAEFDVETPSVSFASPGTQTQAAVEVSQRHKEDPAVGDLGAGLAPAEVTIDREYYTPTQHHNPIELFATTCVWEGEKLTIYEASQFVYGLKNGLAEQLGIDPHNVRAVSPFVGGAFGSKGSVTPRTALIAMAAKRLNRPVKLVVPRDQGFTIATYRAETKHRVRLGAKRDGKLTAFSHEGWEITSRPDSYLVAGTRATTRMYAAPNVASKVYVVHADRNTPGFMRSPPEVPYMYALETAMDELAIELAMDPVELRRVNDTMKDPINGVPYTSRSLMKCYDEAAVAFGWAQRQPAPGSMRDGDWLIGWGCATATYPSQMAPVTARVTLDRKAKARVEVAAHEIGNGAYTVIAQMAGERLGLPLGSVEVRLGDSTLPPGPVAGGSNTTASTCSVVLKACDAIRGKLFHAAVAANDGPLAGQPPASLQLSAGRVSGPDGNGEPLEKVFDRLGVGAIEEYAEWVPHGMTADGITALYNGRTRIIGGPMKDRIAFAFGAEFVEVRVHASTREIRVPRIVGAFAAGHIMNTRTARSQYMGGMIWGIASALHEETELDARRGRYVNTNLADYLVPVNADVASVEVILVPEVDVEVNPAGVKGIGELANVGTAAALSNAVYHATGVRVRKLPIRIEKLLV